MAKDHYEVFDSLGVTLQQVQDRLGKICGHCFFNTARFQPTSSNSCAKYAVFFAYVRFINYDEDFEEVIESYFEENLDKNEQRVQEWFKNDKLSAVLD